MTFAAPGSPTASVAAVVGAGLGLGVGESVGAIVSPVREWSVDWGIGLVNCASSNINIMSEHIGTAAAVSNSHHARHPELAKSPLPATPSSPAVAAVVGIGLGLAVSPSVGAAVGEGVGASVSPVPKNGRGV